MYLLFDSRSRISLMSTLTTGPESRLFWTNTTLRSLRWALSVVAGRGARAGLGQIQFGFHWHYRLSSAVTRHFLWATGTTHMLHFSPHATLKSFTVDGFLSHFMRNPRCLTCWSCVLFPWHRMQFTPTRRPALTWLRREKLTCDRRRCSASAATEEISHEAEPKAHL